jgi:hypothetical protein
MELLDTIREKEVRGSSPVESLQRLVVESSLEDYRLSAIINKQATEKCLSCLSSASKFTADSLFNYKLEEFLGIVKQQQIGQYDSLILAVHEEIRGFLNKRKNIFTLLQIDQSDKNKISSFNKHFFVT